MAIPGRSIAIKPHIGYPGRIGIYFNRTLLSGTVTLAAVGVSGAVVRLVNQATDLEVAKTTTNASGYYEFVNAPIVYSGVNYHIFVEYTNGGTKYNAKSLWNMNTAVTTT